MQGRIDITSEDGGRIRVAVSGDGEWRDISVPLASLRGLLKPGAKEVFFAAEGLKEWDSTFLLLVYEIKSMCSAANVVCDISGLPQNVRELTGLAFAVDRKPTHGTGENLSAVEEIGKAAVEVKRKTSDVLNFIGEVGGAFGRWVTFRSDMRGIDFMAALEDCGPKAVGIVCLISFLIGLILAFVGAVQLESFGAQIYVASLVTIGMCRIMGAIMVGVIMAGRTGSSYAATIGTMQVNEELDALQTMGISKTDFLVMPRLLAMLVSMPLLTMIADFLGILGGAFVGVLLMDLPNQEYWKYALNSFHLNNFLVGAFHGLCFAVIIALCGCYSGLKCGKNADSVGKATTQSVVCAIVWMIVVTGIITVICQELKI